MTVDYETPPAETISLNPDLIDKFKEECLDYATCPRIRKILGEAFGRAFLLGEDLQVVEASVIAEAQQSNAACRFGHREIMSLGGIVCTHPDAKQS